MCLHHCDKFTLRYHQEHKAFRHFQEQRMSVKSDQAVRNCPPLSREQPML